MRKFKYLDNTAYRGFLQQFFAQTPLNLWLAAPPDRTFPTVADEERI